MVRSILGRVTDQATDQASGGVTGSDRPRPQYPIESVDNALRLLLMFNQGTPIRASDASTAIGVARSTAHRLLAMLQYHDFVRQDPISKAYVAGPALFETSLSMIRKLDIRTEARPVLEQLARDSGETIHLAVPQGVNVVFVDSVEGSMAVRVASRIGSVYPAHCTSVGKAMLALLPWAEVEIQLGTGPLMTVTDHSIDDRERLHAELEEVAANGYAISREEAESGVGSVSVAIVGAGDRPVAGLSIATPINRLDDEAIAAFVDLSLTAAKTLSATVV